MTDWVTRMDNWVPPATSEYCDCWACQLHRLGWTSERPTAAGYFYVIISDGKKSHKTLVCTRWNPPEEFWEDYSADELTHKVLEIYEVGSEVDRDWKSCLLWLGPLPVPPDPERL